MGLTLSFHYQPDERALVIGFAQGAGIACQADVDYFSATLSSRCQHVKQRVHLFFDLGNLTVQADLVESFIEAKRELADRFAQTVWHFGGHLAERVMTRNDCTRRGQKPNLFRTREDAMAAFHKSRASATP